MDYKIQLSSSVSATTGKKQWPLWQTIHFNQTNPLNFTQFTHPIQFLNMAMFEPGLSWLRLMNHSVPIETGCSMVHWTSVT